jgi:hypothetical protein
LLGYSQSWVSYVIRRQQILTLDQGRDIARRFGAPVQPLARAGSDYGSAALALAASQPEPVLDEIAPLFSVLGADLPDSSRSALASFGRLIWLARQPASSLREREALYEGLVQVLGTWADTMKRRELLRTLLAQRRLVQVLLPDCPAELRPRLLSLFANMSRFAGWLCFDLKDFDSATWFFEQARTAAHEAENTELGVLTLCNLSHMATWRGQPRVIGVAAGLAARNSSARLVDVLTQSRRHLDPWRETAAVRDLDAQLAAHG